MNGFISKTAGWLALFVGVTGLLALLTLLLFFVSFFQNVPFLSSMGNLNDTMNIFVSFFGATLASALHPTLQRFIPRLSWIWLVAVWAGAIAVAVGSWLIQVGKADVELSSYYFFFGNGLIGIWLWVLNRIARQQAIWPRNLTPLGLIAGVFMMLGLLGLYGILLGLDGNDYSPLIMVTGFSFLGTGILYPIWCLRLGHWILANQTDKVKAAEQA